MVINASGVSVCNPVTVGSGSANLYQHYLTVCDRLLCNLVQIGPSSFFSKNPQGLGSRLVLGVWGRRASLGLPDRRFCAQAAGIVHGTLATLRYNAHFRILPSQISMKNRLEPPWSHRGSPGVPDVSNLPPRLSPEAFSEPLLQVDDEKTTRQKRSGQKR